MATTEQLALVRTYTGEDTEDNWTDVALGALIDELGVEGATARVWSSTQARYARLVDVSEAGASRKMSQAFEHAKEMTEYWDGIVAGLAAAAADRTQVRKIQRA